MRPQWPQYLNGQKQPKHATSAFTRLIRHLGCRVLSFPFLFSLMRKKSQSLGKYCKEIAERAYTHTPPRVCVCALRDRLCLMTTYTQKNILPLSSSFFCYQSTWWVCIISWRLKGGFISKLFIADSTSEIWIHKNQCNYHQEEEEEEEFGADHFGLLPSRKMWNDIFMYVQLLFICLYDMDLSEDVHISAHVTQLEKGADGRVTAGQGEERIKNTKWDWQLNRFVHHIDYAYKLSVTISLNKFRELNQYLRQIASASK